MQKNTEKCISPLYGSFVAFDLVKVNPFNQMITSDKALASLFFNNRGIFFNQSTSTSLTNSKKMSNGRHSMLTLENIQRHDRQIQDCNVKFYPRINRLIDVANKKYQNNNGGGVGRPSTNFTSSFSIFDALYDLESFNNMPSLKDQQQSQ